MIKELEGSASTWDVVAAVSTSSLNALEMSKYEVGEEWELKDHLKKVWKKL